MHCMVFCSIQPIKKQEQGRKFLWTFGSRVTVVDIEHAILHYKQVGGGEVFFFPPGPA